jgi:hypothetical protein
MFSVSHNGQKCLFTLVFLLNAGHLPSLQRPFARHTGGALYAALHRADYLAAQAFDTAGAAEYVVVCGFVIFYHLALAKVHFDVFAAGAAVQLVYFADGLNHLAHAID